METRDVCGRAAVRVGGDRARLPGDAWAVHITIAPRGRPMALMTVWLTVARTKAGAFDLVDSDAAGYAGIAGDGAGRNA